MDGALEMAAANLVALLAARGMSAATAESCTGGMAGAAITSVPGASAVYAGGVISYSNAVKEKVLGVPREILETDGAVSERCARAMAEGARRLLGADFAVSITGIAGPGGAVPGKPVGTVHFAVASEEGTKSDKAIFPGGRNEVRRAAAIHAIGMLSAAAAPA